jgi:hypothetical protein
VAIRRKAEQVGQSGNSNNRFFSLRKEILVKDV